VLAIHDGVRPLVSHQTIERCFAGVGISSAAIPVIEPPESVRMLTVKGSMPLNRCDIAFVIEVYFMVVNVARTHPFYPAGLGFTERYAKAFHGKVIVHKRRSLLRIDNLVEVLHG
jgi:2-C-methyl-D-erythritol 4-phosphate cytidylyltransferase